MKITCCGEEPINMGVWPTIVSLGKFSDPKEDGSMDFIDQGEGHAIVHRYHCKKCNSYIGIAWRQESGKSVIGTELVK